MDGVRGWAEFSLTASRKHLNHASFGAVPTRTLEHQAELKERLESNPHAWFADLPAMHAATRASLAAFVGAPADEIAMVPNASAAASIALSSVPLARGDEVLLTDHAYGAVAMGVERQARRSGANARTVSVPLAAGEDEALRVVLDNVSTRTKVVVVDQVSSPTARLLPVARIAEGLMQNDVVVVVDGAHALGTFPHAAIRAPNVIWFGNLHKYFCAPRGSAVLVAQGDLAGRLEPLIDSWGSGLPFPQNFDTQGTLDSTGFLASAHAVRTLEALFTWDRIRAHSRALGGWARSLIEAELSRITTTSQVPRHHGEPQASLHVGMPVLEQPLLRLPPGVATDGASATELRDSFRQKADCEVGVSTWRGVGFIRISPHAYNTADDYEYFVERALPIIKEASRKS